MKITLSYFMPLALVAFALLGVNPPSVAADQEQASGSAAPPPAAAVSQPAAAASQPAATTHQDRQTPELGVVVASSPGQGVLVLELIPGGPADKAGIQSGDYILALNDQTVANPDELKDRIGKLTQFDTVDVSLWRRGQDITKSVALAAQAKELPDCHRAWLGVRLASGAQADQVVVEEVQPHSPAEKAGLRPGDVIVKFNDNSVDSIDHFVDSVADLGPEAELDLTVRRAGNEQQVQATLGCIDDAPVAWFRRFSMRPFDELPFVVPEHPMMRGNAMMDEMLDEMRSKIRTLEDNVRQLQDAKKSSAKKSNAPQLEDSSSSSASPDRNGVMLVSDGIVEPGKRAMPPDLSNRWQPNISNDWSRSRYRGQRPNYSRPSTPYSPYRVYPYPYPYRYPSYYNYGGRPYFYGAPYPYGYRGGIRVVPNYGVWW